MLPQAFIVFQFERHRNHLVKLFYRTPWQRMALNTPFAACLDVHEQPRLSAADGMPVSLTSAPEPSDVFWEARLHPTLSPSLLHTHRHSTAPTLIRPSPLARTSRKT